MPLLRHCLRIGTILLTAFALVPTASATDCVSGTITAEFQTSGPYAGQYEYTVEMTWDTPQGLSNVTLQCGFSLCPGAACSESWAFPSPAGTGTGGEPDGCGFDFLGEFNCEGNPSIGLDDPILKWDVGSEECEAAQTGSATLTFYTPSAPATGEVPVILIKNGQNVCEGAILGDCPNPCPVPVESRRWGAIKRGAGVEGSEEE